MTRRFALRPGQSSATDWGLTLTVPPAGAYGDTGSGGDGGGDGECEECPECPPGGDCGEPEVFFAGCMTPFLSDGQILLLGIHNLPEDADVVWTASDLDDWNYLISEDGLTSTAHACMAGFFGGNMTITATVNGEDAGGITITDGDVSCPEDWQPTNPREP